MNFVVGVENLNFKLCCFAQQLNVIVLGSIAELFTEILHFFHIVITKLSLFLHCMAQNELN